MTSKSRIRPVDLLAADTDNFAELLEISGLDPKLHLRFADWSGVDFRASDLRNFDFTGARLHNCNFRGALIEGARFDQAELNGTDLRLAADYEAFAADWRRPIARIADDHLPVGAVFHDAPWAPELVVVPPGSFVMGSNGEGEAEEEPAHPRSIPTAFAVGRYPVTRDQFEIFVRRTGRIIPTGGYAMTAKKGWRRSADISWKSPGVVQTGDHPVTCVSWNDAQAFVSWLSDISSAHYRLLTEAEWEYCCRAGSATRYSTGDQISKDQACFDHNGTVPVGSFPPNRFGLYDFHGLVWEWCTDHFNGSYQDAPSDGSARMTGESNLRIIRGGGWTNDEWRIRSTVRMGHAPSYRGQDLGFRIARTLRSQHGVD